MPSVVQYLNINVTFVYNLTEYLDISQMRAYIMENLQNISLEVQEIMPNQTSREQRGKYTMDEMGIPFFGLNKIS